MAGILFSATASRAADGVTGGLMAGVNLANLSIDLVDTDLSINPSTKPGVLLGGFATIPITTMVSIQPEFLFVQRKFDVRTGPSSASLELHRLNAVEIPILARFEFAKAGELGFYAVAGPGISFPISASKTKGDKLDTSVDVKNDYAGVDVGVIGGAGMTFGKIMAVEARYTVGLRQAQSQPAASVTERNRAFAVLFRYRLK